jgi:hypothetical protein
LSFNPKNQSTFPFTYQTFNNPLITAAWGVARGNTPTAILAALKAKYGASPASLTAWDASSPVGAVNHATFARIMFEEGFASVPVAAALKAQSELQPGTALRMGCYNATQAAKGECWAAAGCMLWLTAAAIVIQCGAFFLALLLHVISLRNCSRW